MRKIEMTKAREVLRLKYQTGLSLREIAKSCNCGKSTVAEVLARAEKAKIADASIMSDKQLLSALYPPAEKDTKVSEPDMEYIFKELKKKNVTLMLLWEEYKQDYPDGLMYTQFCDRYREFKKHNKIEFHKEHKAGEEMECDWVGTTMEYIDTSTGEIKEAYIFLSVLPASNYPFIFACENMKSGNWIDAHVRAFRYYGGVPRITIPDNTKTAVTKTDIYDPILNRSYYEMADHYRTTILPARPEKPKDKAAVENAVGNISRKIIAALRNRQFFSIGEINKALEKELAKFIKKPFQKMEETRLELFNVIDKPALQPLPKAMYELADWKEGNKVPFNYHIEYDKFFYSVGYEYVGQKYSIRATSRIIEVFVDNERIAAHERNHNKRHRYSTVPEHMPENHKVVSNWNDERFRRWAEKVGWYTQQYISEMLDCYEYPVQSYRACMGIMRLAETEENHIVEKASREALERKTFSFKYYNMIFKKVKEDAENENKQQPAKVIMHDNLRGRHAFGGEVNA